MNKDHLKLKNRLHISIDGAAGVGKSSLSEKLAEKYNLFSYSSGEDYRYITFLAMKNKVNLGDEKAIGKMMKSFVWDNLRDWAELDTKEITENVSQIASYKVVRDAVKKPLKRLVKNKNRLVIDGRDIGSVIMPKADFKFFLTASVDARAKWRMKQIKENDLGIAIQLINIRDFIDSTRKIAPLKKTKDMIEIKCDGLSLNEVFDKLCGIIEKGEKNDN